MPHHPEAMPQNPEAMPHHPEAMPQNPEAKLPRHGYAWGWSQKSSFGGPPLGEMDPLGSRNLLGAPASFHPKPSHNVHIPEDRKLAILCFVDHPL